MRCRRLDTLAVWAILSCAMACDGCRAHSVPSAPTDSGAADATKPTAKASRKLPHVEQDEIWTPARSYSGAGVSEPRFSADGHLFWKVSSVGGSSLFRADLRSGQWAPVLRGVCFDDWELASGLSVLQCNRGGVLHLSLDGHVEGTGPPVPSGDLSPDGRYLACTSDVGCVVDTRSGLDLLPNKGRRLRRPVTGVLWAEDSSCVYRDLASEGVDDYETSEVVCPARANIQEYPRACGGGASWSSDGALVAGGCGRIWDASGLQARLHQVPLTGRVTAVAFRPGSHEFATAQRDGTISRWNADEGQQAGVALSGHDSAVSALAWTPDGAKLASVDRDGGVLLQDGNGTSIAHVEVGRSLADLRFSPDGQVLVGTAPKELVLIHIGDLRLFAIAAVWMEGSVEIVAYDEDGDVDGSPEAMARLHGARGRRDGLLRALLGQ